MNRGQLSLVLLTACLLLALAILVMSLAAPTVLGLAPSPAAPQFQLLTNPGMEVYDPPYGQFEGVDCQVASGWQRFWYGGAEPCWMDTRVFAASDLTPSSWVERREGDTSQLIVSREPYTAGLWQQVTGLTPGVGYGFRGPMLTIFQTSDQEPVDGTMIKQVGVDSSGGTDPLALTVVWSEPDGSDQQWDVQRRVAFWAEAPTATVFVRVISLYPSGDPSLFNLSFLDWNILAETPLVTATSPAVSEEPTFSVSWDNAQAAPGGEVVKYDVQWLDEAKGVWHDWFERTSDVQANFAGEWGHVYRFRARAWQRYEDDQRLFGPYCPDGDTSTRVGGPRLAGLVTNHEGRPVDGAAVSISGTAYAAVSGADGRYGLDLEALAGPQIASVSDAAWLSPAPVYDVTFGPTQTVALTWTLRPPDDAIANGGFEAGLGGWTPISEQGMEPEVVGGPVHTGFGALALGSSAPTSLTIGVSQTAALTNAWEPALSFWYYPITEDADDLLNVVVSLPGNETRVFTPALDVQGWTHQWYHPGPPGTFFTGTLDIRFQVWHDGDSLTTTVYLDEVSLGATPGGPFVSYVPLVFK